jgi:hypothetical protein
MWEHRLMSASLHRHRNGITWAETGSTARSAHAVVDGEQVWLIDPFDDADALAAANELGNPTAVIQLLDRHRRDGASIAARLGVPLLQMPSTVPSSPFTVIEVMSRSRWREIALWWEAERTLIVAEAIGTGPLFALGRRAGVHPILRLVPPRAALGGYAPERMLVGHGPPVDSDAGSALTEALDNARSDIPKLLISLPKALRRG